MILSLCPGLYFMSHLFAPNRRNIEFHELFKNIPQDELLIDSKKIYYSNFKKNFRLFMCTKQRDPDSWEIVSKC